MVTGHFAETFEGNGWKSNPKVAYEGRQGFKEPVLYQEPEIRHRA
jgi:hypothetical protein